MLKPTNLQIKSIKEDKTFFVNLNHLNKKRMHFDKTLRRNT